MPSQRLHKLCEANNLPLDLWPTPWPEIMFLHQPKADLKKALDERSYSREDKTDVYK